MNSEDRTAIADLFGKLAAVERQAAPRDADSEAFIQDQIGRQPGAPYYMAQTIVVQEHALEAANARIAELERGPAHREQPRRGGLFSGLFGGNDRPAARSASPWGGTHAPVAPAAAPRQGGGFLAGAAQTAVGVAGGMMLGSAIGGMFGADEAQAAEPAGNEPAEDAGDDDGGFFDAFGGDE